MTLPGCSDKSLERNLVPQGGGVSVLSSLRLFPIGASFGGVSNTVNIILPWSAWSGDLSRSCSHGKCTPGLKGPVYATLLKGFEDSITAQIL